MMETRTWKAASLLLLAALFGGAVGSAVTARLADPGHRDHGRRGHGSEWYVSLLTRELDLSSAQQDSVRSLLARRRQGMDSLYALIRPSMEQIRDSIRADVRALLTPAQQERYRALSARLDARRQEAKKRDSTNP
jgi:Spy/CpxP family protein refolding chaperone